MTTNLIITANSRLARHWQNKTNQNHSSSSPVWETPPIVPLSVWLETTFHQTNQDGKILLNTFQERHLIETIIEEIPLSEPLIQPASLPDMVSSAWELLTLWEIPVEQLMPFDAQVEVQALTQWIQAFQKICADHRWVTAAEIPHLLIAREKINPLKLPAHITLAGFDDINPAIQSLFNLLKQRMVICHEDDRQTHGAVIRKIILDDTESEINTMALWAKKQIEQNPAANIGCIVPELAQHRATVARLFSDTFDHSAIAPFNISTGFALSQLSMVKIALTILQWCIKPLPIQTFHALTQSTFFCQDETEKNQYARMDTQWRKQNKLTVSLQDIYQLNPNTRLTALYKKIKENKIHQAKPSQWVNIFIERLQCVGWPGHETQHSDIFQLLESVKKSWKTLATLDHVIDTLSAHAAIKKWQQLLQLTLFQPKSHNEPIQIMGALEAGGITFDAIWVMGLDDQRWPAPANPHPLIPFSIQQDHDMPHATAKRELAFCTAMTARLKKSASLVIFSSPSKIGDQLRFPSRLISDIQFTTRDELQLPNHSTLSKKIWAARTLENWVDEKTPMTDFASIRGGSEIIKLQSLCPFRAFSTIRLRAKKIVGSDLGVSSKDKGIFVHEILCEIWGELKNQKALCALSESQLKILVKKWIDSVFMRHQSDSMTESDYFFRVEKKRLQKIILEWLAFEKTRPDFSVILREAMIDVQIKNLPLKIRLDRVDEYPNGKKLLIDYKTGKSTIADWNPNKIKDPQLPLYAVLNESCSGIAFAKINNEKYGIEGYADSLLPKHHQLETIDWKMKKQTWKEMLETLAEQFCDGDHRVRPLEKNTCQLCDLQSLCRYKTETVLS
ncbi:MAG: hypothetical protein A3I77_06975 [Gammaproteobacteria bacterium RIFCSPLOWO2_02_FULL_42_14]|nr:MAG: hypothetical protein A3B71_02810 [Gammaproteobacteria bacterium RIFCSPHIGHO2_02_FULL_42_43]OGT51999.1 MAG: hypothetical protein A3E54_04315 [Gammaproteobacteria bacterium RIFCSPHIGHO2_12_FULL_41_25]OGT61104.1 MAG: hypothetical protein A3I77_06975 [Gammaproteobacteria bacterium RIFCSPLOWO2_02_FULL_42_14]OGT87032.1 MAG: hypothetical protein A3G86_00695 [Gammaproteobacteria bacterium RIFCSPLOWO2_12_FULL_42_18]